VKSASVRDSAARISNKQPQMSLAGDDMHTATRCSSIQGHAVMAATVFAIVAVFTLLDVQIVLARFDPMDPTTSSHLGRPQTAYLFIPVLAAVVAAIAAFANFMLGLISRRRLVRTKHWASLGASFAMICVAQPISAIGLNDPVVLWLSGASATVFALLVHRRYAVPKSH